MERQADERTSYLAMLELRLEATRRPALRAELTAAVRTTLDANIRFHLDAGLPGGADDVLVLSLAMTGLLLEALTLPGVLAEDQLGALVEKVVTRSLPPAAGRPRDQEASAASEAPEPADTP